jgi:hypothetical protein
MAPFFMSNKIIRKFSSNMGILKERFTFLGANVHYLNNLAKAVKESYLG